MDSHSVVWCGVEYKMNTQDEAAGLGNTYRQCPEGAHHGAMGLHWQPAPDQALAAHCELLSKEGGDARIA